MPLYSELFPSILKIKLRMKFIKAYFLEINSSSGLKYFKCSPENYCYPPREYSTLALAYLETSCSYTSIAYLSTSHVISSTVLQNFVTVVLRIKYLFQHIYQN